MTARSPTSSIARGAADVAIDPTTRNAARSTTASRDSSSQVTSACGAAAAAASDSRSANGAAAASTTNFRRFTTGIRRAARDGSRCARYVETVSHPDLESEQRYVDSAYHHLERMRQVVASAGDKVDG